MPIASLFRRPFRIVHVAWALLILLGCVALVAMGGGHPPPMVFVPFLLLAGLAGHVLLLLIQWLLGRGRRRFAAGDDGVPRWPPELVLIALVLGAFAILATVVTVGEIARLRTRPGEWFVYAAVATVHLTAILLLLLRIQLARYVVGLLSLGWAVVLALQFREARPGEWPLGVGVLAILVTIAVYVLRAQRIRDALC